MTTYEIGDRVTYGYGNGSPGVVKATSDDWLWVKFDSGAYSSVRANDAGLQYEAVEVGSVWQGSYGSVKVHDVEGDWVIYHAYGLSDESSVNMFFAMTKDAFLARYRSVTDVR